MKPTWIITYACCLILMGCTTTIKRINNLSLGMTKSEVINVLGDPYMSTAPGGGVEVLQYKLQRARPPLKVPLKYDYSVKLLDGRVVAFGVSDEHEENQPPPNPITSIRIGTFKCADNVTADAVRNVFMEVIASKGTAKVLREGEADVVIEGTVTLGIGDSSSASIGASAYFAGGKGRSAGGSYVSGVTALVLRNGELLTSASWGQSLGKGASLLPPESVARETAQRLSEKLLKQGLRRRE